MEEKVLIQKQSKHNLAKAITVFASLCILVPLVVCAVISADYNANMIGWLFRYAFHGYIYPIVIGGILLPQGVGGLFGEITVTDKRVYGTAGIHRRVDLPIHAISAVSSASFSTITVSTSSGVIKFRLMEDRNAVVAQITELLANQTARAVYGQAAPAPVVANTDAEDIAKFKKLLDDGAITQEEYDAKKKQLLGL